MNCSNRSVGCHGKCMEYIEQRKRLDEFNKKKNNILSAEHDYISYYDNLGRKLKRKQHTNIDKNCSYR